MLSPVSLKIAVALVVTIGEPSAGDTRKGGSKVSTFALALETDVTVDVSIFSSLPTLIISPAVSVPVQPVVLTELPNKNVGFATTGEPVIATAGVAREWSCKKKRPA